MQLLPKCRTIAGTPTKEEKSELEMHQVTPEINISKC